MDGYTLSRKIFNFAFENQKCKYSHIALFLWIVELNNRLGRKKQFGLPTNDTCEGLGYDKHLHIKILKELEEWKFIKIISLAKNQYQSCIIELIIDKKCCVENRTALDTALSQHYPQHSPSTTPSTSPSTSPIDKQSNKETKKQINNNVSNETDKTKELENKKEYGDPEINEILRAIKDNHGTIDGTQKQQRIHGRLLRDKIKKIEGFDGRYYDFIDYIIKNSDEYRISKTTSAYLLWQNLSNLIANIKKKQEITKIHKI